MTAKIPVSNRDRCRAYIREHGVLVRCPNPKWIRSYDWAPSPFCQEHSMHGAAK